MYVASQKKTKVKVSHTPKERFAALGKTMPPNKKPVKLTGHDIVGLSNTAVMNFHKLTYRQKESIRGAFARAVALAVLWNNKRQTKKRK